MNVGRKHLAAAFCFGLLAGAFFYGLWARHLHHRRHDYAARRAHVLDKFSRRLNLDEPQRIRVKAILARKGERMHAVYEELRSTKIGVREDARAEIRAFLSEDQRAAFEKMTREFDKRRILHVFQIHLVRY